MEAIPVKKEMVVVVNETIADAEKFIKTLFLWPVVAMGAQMPFSEKCGPVTSIP